MAELTDVATEVADKVVEEADHIVEVSRRLSGREIRLVLAGVGVGAIAVAVAAAINERQMRKRYAEQAEAEIDQMREHFRARQVAREEKPSLDELKGVVEDAGYSSTQNFPRPGTSDIDDSLPREVGVTDPKTGIETAYSDPAFEALPPETRNVFRDQNQEEIAGDGWDYATELVKRTQRQIEKRPYVIHEDEQQEMDYNETEFSYYEGDDVVCDSENRIVSNPEAIIGEDFRDKFGHGAEDPNVCFVRNDVLAADIEVTRWEAMYSVEVQGLEEEVEFESHRKTQFDDDD